MSGVDLVCGPDGPLPDSRGRYRLLEHLGSGGQAEVYRGVRVSAGLESASVTVKVFRNDSRFSLGEQLRFWDKGDAVLMDLTGRGIANICLRVDGFYGLPPRDAVVPALEHETRLPYQILDYLPGNTLIQRLRQEAAESTKRLDGRAVLQTLAEILTALHDPPYGGLPVLHMDVKPSNVIISPDGAAKLIDFTASRYFDAAHLTTIAYSPESGGPEAQNKSAQLTPAYDVHGFGAVAYYLVTGWHPRESRRTPALVDANPVRTALRRHPMLEENPQLAKHLYAPLADNPADRPRADELAAWVTELAELACQPPHESQLVQWSKPQSTRPPPRLVDTAAYPIKAIIGSARVPDPPTLPNARAAPMQWAPKSESVRQPSVRPGQADIPVRTRGGGVLALSTLWFLLCWLVWLATEFIKVQSVENALLGLGYTVAGAIGVYWLTRFAGYLLRSTLELPPLRSTFVPYLTTSIFLVACGISFLSFTPLDLMRLWQTISQSLS